MYINLQIFVEYANYADFDKKYHLKIFIYQWAKLNQILMAWFLDVTIRSTVQLPKWLLKIEIS